MEIQQLRYFVAVAEAASFTRAAERCHVSQPSLSQQIRKLEDEVGRPLFQRLGRRVLLTEAGRLLLERAKAILFELEETERRLADEGAHGGRVDVGAIPTVAPYLLPPVLRRFRRRNPRVDVRLHEDVTESLLKMTAAGELDVAIAALPIDDDRLEVRELLTEPLFLALPKRHPLASRTNVRIRDIEDERFILLHEVHCLATEIEAFCNQNRFTPKVACRSAQLATVLELIALGQGISLIPAMARRADAGGRRTYRCLVPAVPRRTIVALWHRRRYRTPASERFLELLEEEARSLERKGTRASAR